MNLDGYSERVETFRRELAREHHRHFAGLQAEFDIAGVYAHHAELFTAQSVDALRESDHRGGEEVQRRRRALLRFAAEGHLNAATAGLQGTLARREAELVVHVKHDAGRTGSETLPFSEIAGLLAGEPDPQRRAALDTARREAVDESLTPLAEQILARRQRCTAALGWSSYHELSAQLTGVDLDALEAQASGFLAATAQVYPAIVQPALKACLGTGLGDLRRADLPRLWRQPHTEAHFPRAGLSQALEATLNGLGIETRAQSNVIVDIDARPGKSRRAFCAPVRVPEEIYLVMAPRGGRQDYAALLHESGHAQHFAATDPRLRVEQRLLGDPAVGEAFAFLFDRLVEEPGWLRARLGVGGELDRLTTDARALRLILLRRHAAKLKYELTLYRVTTDQGAAGLADVYAAALSDALGVAWPRDTWLTDMDPGLYVVSYLRAWALEAHLRRALNDRFGQSWFTQSAAGAFLSGLWHTGQSLDAEGLLAALAPGASLDFADLAGEFVGSEVGAPSGRSVGEQELQ